MSSKDQKEIEAKLLITAQNPADVLSQIARISSMLNYRLVKGGRINLQDIYLDTSFVLRQMHGAFRERFLKEHPPERLLFASDSPWTDQGEELRFLLELPYLTDSDKEKICFLNAAGLLGLQE